MAKPTVISIDAMGGDHGPSVVVPGVADYLRANRDANVRFLLHGDEAALVAELRRALIAAEACDIRHTDKVVAMDEKPAQAMRRGRGSSLWNAIQAVKDGEAAAAVSAGNTGALMAISLLILRMAAQGLERPALVAGWPTVHGGHTVVLDVGANIECDAAQLVEFAIMGEAYCSAVHGVDRPTIGVLNVGSEDMKGHEEVREAARLLRENDLGLRYHGFVEGTDLSRGTVDVVVTDGFTGNVALKTAEGTARLIAALLRESLQSGVQSRIGGALALPALQKMRQRIDPNVLNGGPLLGLNGLVVKSHGGANATGIAAAIRIAVDLGRSDYLQKVSAKLKRFEKTVPATAHAAPETE